MHSSEPISATEHILALRDYPRKPAYFLAALEDIFAELGHIPDASKAIIQSYFTLQEWPKHLVSKLFHNTTITGSKTVMVCEGPCCKKAGADLLADQLQLFSNLNIERHHCMGSCKNGPAVIMKDTLIPNASVKKIKRLL